MSSRIRQTKLDSPKGDFMEYLKNQHMSFKSDGAGLSGYTRTVAYDFNGTSITPGQNAKFYITAPASWDVTDFNRGFLHVTVTQPLVIDSALSGLATAPYANVVKLFVGYKSASQAIHRMTLQQDGVDVKEFKDQEISNYLNDIFRSRQEKDDQKYVYTNYDALQAYSSQFVGKVFNASVFASSTTATISFEMIIPICSMLPLGGFDLLHKSVGSLDLQIEFSNSSMVWCMLNPSEVALLTNICNYNIYDTAGATNRFTISQLNYLADGFNFTHEFTSIGNVARIIDSITVASGVPTITINEHKLDVSSATATTFSDLEAWTYGYKIKGNEAAKDFITNNVLYIGGQTCEVTPVNAPTTAGWNMSHPIVLNNCESISILAGKTAKDFVCYTNPMMQSVQVTLDDRALMTSQPFATTDPELVKYIYGMSDLPDFGLPMDTAFAESYRSRNDDSGYRLISPSSDQSNFVLFFSLERANAKNVFDGVTSPNCQLKIVGTPQYTGSYTLTDSSSGVHTYYQDSNYYVNPTGTILNTQAVQVVTCSDILFTIYKGKLKFHNEPNLESVVEKMLATNVVTD